MVEQIIDFVPYGDGADACDSSLILRNLATIGRLPESLQREKERIDDATIMRSRLAATYATTVRKRFEDVSVAIVGPGYDVAKALMSMGWPGSRILIASATSPLPKLLQEGGVSRTTKLEDAIGHARILIVSSHVSSSRFETVVAKPLKNFFPQRVEREENRKQEGNATNAMLSKRVPLLVISCVVGMVSSKQEQLLDGTPTYFLRANNVKTAQETPRILEQYLDQAPAQGNVYE